MSLWRAGVRGWREASPRNAAAGTPSPACPCGRRPGAIPPRLRRPSGPSRSRWSRRPRNRPGRPPIRRRPPTRRPRTSRRR
ncbi:hypothetical protein DWZ01_02400 [Collinsella sp. AF28-5AC]|nr:hypothetical protein DWZ01_02400 [Collinsella sp. AF28-5AC]